MNIYALHGFLGQPHDWSFLPQVTPVELKPIIPFSDWAQQFNNQYQNCGVLLGYSLGGRLALHALEQSPEQWSAAIFISTHPGLIDGKKERYQSDTQWAQRFLSEPWDQLMDSWNRQSVFSGHQIYREESDFDRTILASMLSCWSLGNQKRIPVEQFKIPVLWLVGENDTKFVAIAKNLRFSHPLSKVAYIPNAGHRLLWEQPDEIKIQIDQFLESSR